jgi:hypothetical protein
MGPGFEGEIEVMQAIAEILRAGKPGQLEIN